MAEKTVVLGKKGESRFPTGLLHIFDSELTKEQRALEKTLTEFGVGKEKQKSIIAFLEENPPVGDAVQSTREFAKYAKMSGREVVGVITNDSETMARVMEHIWRGDTPSKQVERMERVFMSVFQVAHTGEYYWKPETALESYKKSLDNAALSGEDEQIARLFAMDIHKLTAFNAAEAFTRARKEPNSRTYTHFRLEDFVSDAADRMFEAIRTGEYAAWQKEGRDPAFEVCLRPELTKEGVSQAAADELLAYLKKEDNSYLRSETMLSLAMFVRTERVSADKYFKEFKESSSNREAIIADLMKHAQFE